MAKKNKIETTAATGSFEESLKELKSVVQKLEAGELSLDASIALFERGIQLNRTCEQQLKMAEERVEKLKDELQLDGNADADD